jgi:hypothetical protein
VFVDHRKNEMMLVPVKTLGEILKQFGEAERELTYLKVDVEGSELKAIGEWIRSDSLARVRQEWNSPNS